MYKKIMITGLLLGITGIILGAFGAHTLKKMLSIEALVTFETGVKYQIYHALFLLFLSNSLVTDKAKSSAFYLIISGVVCFCGSIYIIALKDIIGITIGKLGIITPIGGVLLIAGWFVVLLNVLSKK
jgi:uncharacterized membrane protein YgdD (TMEM256/DUF423 family)